MDETKYHSQIEEFEKSGGPSDNTFEDDLFYDCKGRMQNHEATSNDTSGIML